MDVTVSLPTLNEEKYLPKCLDDLKAAKSNVEDFEISVQVVDSKSDDRTVEIAEEHEVVNDVLSCEKGLLKARDKGIREADGEIVVCVDADASYPEDYLSELLSPFEREGVDMTYGDVLRDDSAFPIDLSITYYFQKFLELIGFHYVHGSSRAIRKSAYIDLGGYDLSKDGNSVSKVMMEEQVRFPNKIAESGEIEHTKGAKVKQSKRNLKNFLFLENKKGGRDWDIYTHSHLKRFIDGDK